MDRRRVVVAEHVPVAERDGHGIDVGMLQHQRRLLEQPAIVAVSPPRRRRAHRRRERVGAFEQLARERQQHRAGRAQRDAALAALEQARAERRLEALDGLRQRRLRHREARGGTAEVAFLGEDGELAQLPQVELGIIH